MDREAALVERQGRRHRAVVLLHVAVVHGHREPAAPGVPRALRRNERSVPLPGFPRRDREQLPLVLVQRERARAEPVPGERRPPARPGEGFLPRRAAPSELRRLLEGARRRGEPGENQGAGFFHRRLGQDGAASGRQYPRLPQSVGAEEALHHRHGDCGHFADRFQQRRVPQETPPALLRQAPEGREDGLRRASQRRIRREEHGRRTLIRVLAAAWRAKSEVLSRQRTDWKRHIAQRRFAAERAPAVDGGSTTYAYPHARWVLRVVAVGSQGPDPAAAVLTFTSTPLDADMEVAGHGKAILHASSTRNDMDFHVKLSEQFPQAPQERAKGAQPRYAIVTKGWLRASHGMERDASRSTDDIPHYTHASPKPLTPGKVYALA